MPRAFADITFTPSVRAAQTRYGSREANSGFERAEDSRSELSGREVEFILARDSFYQATVAENGWPYVQHRGGPPGFLRVLDEHTIGYADFRGNVQYLSVGNLNADERISLILMDYANRRRLKIWGRARIVHEAEEPELVARLEMPAYRAEVERGIVIRVEAWDWNCPQHITPRFTEREAEEALLAPLQAENEALKARLAEPQRAPVPPELGDGPLTLVVSGVRQLTPEIRAIELRDADGGELPAIAPGVHLRLPVLLGNGEPGLRHYSISSNPHRRDAWEIAVLRQGEGGGSAFVQDAYTLGRRIRCEAPQNHFPLQTASHHLLIAGGIGITPLKAMAMHLKARGENFTLHYAARSARHMAYRDRLQREFGPRLHTWFSDRGSRMGLRAILQDLEEGGVVYVCGPGRLIDAVRTEAAALGIPADRIRVERFDAGEGADDQPFEVELARSGRRLRVTAGRSLLETLEEAGVQVQSDCRAGNCGSCQVRVLGGEVEHRDSALNERERGAGLMCACVSRSRSPLLKLEL